MTLTINTHDLAEDLLKGASAIGAFMGLKPRAAYYLLEKREVPGFKIGNIWYARRSTLLNHFAELEVGHE